MEEGEYELVLAGYVSGGLNREFDPADRALRSVGGAGVTGDYANGLRRECFGSASKRGLYSAVFSFRLDLLSSMNCFKASAFSSRRTHCS